MVPFDPAGLVRARVRAAGLARDLDALVAIYASEADAGALVRAVSARRSVARFFGLELNAPQRGHASDELRLRRDRRR